MVWSNSSSLVVLFIKARNSAEKDMAGVSKLLVMVHIMKDIGRMMLLVARVNSNKQMADYLKVTLKMINPTVKANTYQVIKNSSLKVSLKMIS